MKKYEEGDHEIWEVEESDIFFGRITPQANGHMGTPLLTYPEVEYRSPSLKKIAIVRGKLIVRNSETRKISHIQYIPEEVWNSEGNQFLKWGGDKRLSAAAKEFKEEIKESIPLTFEDWLNGMEIGIYGHFEDPKYIYYSDFDGKETMKIYRHAHHSFMEDVTNEFKSLKQHFTDRLRRSSDPKQLLENEVSRLRQTFESKANPIHPTTLGFETIYLDIFQRHLLKSIASKYRLSVYDAQRFREVYEDYYLNPIKELSDFARFKHTTYRRASITFQNPDVSAHSFSKYYQWHIANQEKSIDDWLKKTSTLADTLNQQGFSEGLTENLTDSFFDPIAKGEFSWKAQPRKGNGKVNWHSLIQFLAFLYERTGERKFEHIEVQSLVRCITSKVKNKDGGAILAESARRSQSSIRGKMATGEFIPDEKLKQILDSYSIK